MARKPRVYTKTGIYHVIMRGNDQQNLFIDESDRDRFLSRLNKYATELNIDIYAYCLMSNHVHILIGKASKSLSKLVQKLANSYVYYFNTKYERSGHLFQGRFKSEPIENDEYFKTVYRYILQNPEKIKIKMESFKWSSYQNLDNDTKNSIVNTNYIFSLFDGRKNALDFVKQKSMTACMDFENLHKISDKEGLEIIKTNCNIISPFELNRLSPQDLFQKIQLIKSKGLSINQISRLTGISRGIIKLA